jgi:transcriptional regulator with XRE-family HTH domain
MVQSVVAAYHEMSKGDLLAAMRGQFPNLTQMAKVLGVTPRTAQRWYTGGKEQRSPSKKMQEKMKRLLPAKANVKGKFYFDTPGFRESPDSRDRNIDFSIAAKDMARIQDAILAGDDELAYEIFFEAYGMAAPDTVIGGDYTLVPGG